MKCHWFPARCRGQVVGWFMTALPVAIFLGGPISTTLLTQLDGLLGRHDGPLRCGPERPIGLRAVHPDALADPGRIGALPDRVDHPGAVAVRDHARERHPVAQPVAALLRVAGVDARQAQTDPDVARAGLWRRQVPDLQDLRSRSGLLVPRRAHPPSVCARR